LNILEFTLLILLRSFFAGFLGSLTGLGGGVVIAPLLGPALGVDVRYAIGSSLRFRHRHFLRPRGGLGVGSGWVSGPQAKVGAWRVHFGAASASGRLASNAD